MLIEGLERVTNQVAESILIRLQNIELRKRVCLSKRSKKYSIKDESGDDEGGVFQSYLKEYIIC